MSKLTVHLTGDPGSLLRAMEKVVRAEKRMGQEAARTGEKSVRASKKAEGGMKSFGDSASKAFNLKGAISKFAGAFSAGAAIAAGVRLVKTDLQELAEVEKTMSERVSAWARSWRDLAHVVTGYTQAEARATGEILTQEQSTKRTITMLDSWRTKIVGSSGETGMLGKYGVTDAPGFINALVATISSAAVKPEVAFPAMALGAQMRPYDMDVARQIGVGIVNVGKATGFTDPLQNLGVIARIGALSQVVELEKQAQMIPQAMVASRGFGATWQESGALFAALSVALAEPMGDMTRTAITRFAESLSAYFQDLSVEEEGVRRAELRKQHGDNPLLQWGEQERAEFMAGKEYFGKDFNAEKSIEYLREDPARAMRFMMGAKFGRGFYKSTIGELISGTDPKTGKPHKVAEEFARILEELNAEGPANFSRAATEAIKAATSTMQDVADQLKRLHEGLSAEFSVRSIEQARKSIGAEGLSTAMKEAQLGAGERMPRFAARMLQRLEYWWATEISGKDPTTTEIKKLQEVITEFEKKRLKLRTSWNDPGTGFWRKETADEVAARLRELPGYQQEGLGYLKQIVEQLKLMQDKEDDLNPKTDMVGFLNWVGKKAEGPWEEARAKQHEAGVAEAERLGGGNAPALSARIGTKIWNRQRASEAKAAAERMESEGLAAKDLAKRQMDALYDAKAAGWVGSITKGSVFEQPLFQERLAEQERQAAWDAKYERMGPTGRSYMDKHRPIAADHAAERAELMSAVLEANTAALERNTDSTSGNTRVTAKDAKSQRQRNMMNQPSGKYANASE